MSEHNPYAPPEAPRDRHDSTRPLDDERRPHVEGNALVVHRDAKLPRRCVKCATKADVSDVPSAFEYVPVWARVGFGALGALAFRRAVTLSLPFCTSCKLILEERKRAFGRMSLGVLALIFLPGILALMADRDARGPLALVTVLGMVGGIGFLVMRRRSHLDPYTVRSELVKDHAAWLLGVSPAFVDRATKPPKTRR